MSAAAVWHMRDELDNAGFQHVKIVTSSGFSPDKCRVFSLAKAPVDVIGTGSYLPQNWTETYATADIIAMMAPPGKGRQRVSASQITTVTTDQPEYYYGCA